MSTPAKAYLCPTCSSANVTTPVLIGGQYKCGTCGWEGDDPILIPFFNPHGSAEDSFRLFAKEFLTEFAKVAAMPLGKKLVDWGFVPRDHNGKPQTAVLARYLKAMADGMIDSLLAECKKIEAEKTHERS